MIQSINGHPSGSGGNGRPKIWLPRFRPQSDPDAPETRPIRYRFLCLSRNLTFDHSWDTMLVLEGIYQQQRRVAYGRNHPLGDFIAGLPEMAVRPVPETIQAAVKKMSQEVRKVDFETPDWATDLEFMPLGLTGRRSWPFRQGLSRQLIISPFITTGFLIDLTAQARQSILISRLECLEAADPKALAPFADIYYLDPEALPLLPGALEAAHDGVRSSLTRANAMNRSLMNWQNADAAIESLLFDPQTSGGLLAAVPAEAEATVLDDLVAAGYEQARSVGQVSEGRSVTPILVGST